MKRVNVGNRANSSAGVTLVEILIVVALSGLLAALTLKMVLNKPNDAWPRVTEDYIHHLSGVFNKTLLEKGIVPTKIPNSTSLDPNACPRQNNELLYPDGTSSVLQNWESVANYVSTSPAYLNYPSGIFVYVNPEDTNIPDTSNMLPRHQAGALVPFNFSPTGNPTGNVCTAAQTVMSGTDDRNWLLLDLNGTTGPNTLGLTGDRVLLLVDEATGRILTAWQKCKEFQGQTGYTVTVNAGAGTCTISVPAPSRVYYQSAFDSMKGY